jgi:S-DNA-T family DNA segregation ATPase FtsK/SpoIIIE
MQKSSIKSKDQNHKKKQKANTIHLKKIQRGTTGEVKKVFLSGRAKEVILVLIGALSLFLMLALASYHQTDSSWSYRSNAMSVQNSAGKMGAFTADFILSFLGFFGFLLPVLLAYGAWILYHDPKNSLDGVPQKKFNMGLWGGLLRILGVAFIFLGGSGLSALVLKSFGSFLPEGAGGILGELVFHAAMPDLNLAGSFLLFTISIALGFTFYGGLRWIDSSIFLGRGIYRLFQRVCSAAMNFFTQRVNVSTPNAPLGDLPQEPLKAKTKEEVRAVPSIFSRNSSVPELDNEEDEESDIEEPGSFPIRERISEEARVKPQLKVTLPAKLAPLPEVGSVLTASHDIQGDLPSVELLDLPNSKPQEVSEDSLHALAQLAEEKLNDFGVDAKVVGAIPGPVITRFELQLAAGVKVSKLTNLAKDLARSLSVHSVRVVEVIPGKSYVGLEIPNETRQTVRLREVLSARAYLDHPSPLAMGLGLNIQGAPEVVDLQKMPHLLVAGTTGSGKSVGLNAMLLSLLLKSTPEHLRLIMIDPKMLELSIYEGIPHLLAPVVTDMKEAANALRWCVKEMDRRYQLMAAMAVRNIGGYNEKVKAAADAGSPILNPLQPEGTPNREPLSCMPYIVVLVDEFADMIMVVGKKVEELIARLAQKARAAGIHLIVATQRPSVDVITGLIKANIPTRMAFQVSSKIDSRTILDQSGAEQLLGYGDMLYLPPGSGHPIRVHGAFVSDQEVQKIVEAWRAKGAPQYHPEVMKSLSEEEGEEGEGGRNAEGRDELFDEAVQIVLETQRASISAVQRRLRIGYNRAARLIEEMEAAGIVSEIMPNGMREVVMRQ